MIHLKKILALTLLAILLTACGENNTVPIFGAAAAATPIITPVITKRTTVTKAELNYPAARWLSDQDIWPTGRPSFIQGDLFGVFITTDSQQQVLDFYQKKLVSLGLAYEPSYNCSEPLSCPQIYGLDGSIMECVPDHKFCAETYSFQFTLVKAGASRKDDSNGNIPETIYSLAKMGQTLVLFGGGPYRPFQIPPAITTTAALITTTPSPKP